MIALKTDENVMGIPVFFAGVMNIVGCHIFKSHLFCQLQVFIVCSVFLHSVPLNFHIKAIFSENLYMFFNSMLGFHIFTVQVKSGYFTVQAGGKTDETF